MRKAFKYIAASLLALAVAPGCAFSEDAGNPPAGSHCVVVVDPGHGGEDTGAVGPSGKAEKDITLGVARKLSAMISERTSCAVLLTREDDTFIPLEERTAIANRVGADIFISIHVNAAASRSVDGIETFFLSFDSTDEDARRVAAFENSFSIAGELKSEDGADLKEILVDMANTESHHESFSLAESVHSSLLGALRKEDRGIKQAPFTVLVGATMPAILVEVGFITNPREERQLASARGQTVIADSITAGVEGFRKTTAKGNDYLGFYRPDKKE